MRKRLTINLIPVLVFVLLFSSMTVNITFDKISFSTHSYAYAYTATDNSLESLTNNTSNGNLFDSIFGSISSFFTNLITFLNAIFNPDPLVNNVSSTLPINENDEPETTTPEIIPSNNDNNSTNLSSQSNSDSPTPSNELLNTPEPTKNPELSEPPAANPKDELSAHSGTIGSRGKKANYVCYAGAWNTSIKDINTKNIPSYVTILNLAFVRPNTKYVKGSLAFDQEVSGLDFVEGATSNSGQKKISSSQAKELINNIAELKKRGTKVYISVGGYAYSQGTEWKNVSAKNLVDLAVDLGASGIDIDWEANGASANKAPASSFACSTDSEIKNIISSVYKEIQSQSSELGLSMACFSTGAYYVKGTPFEEGKVQWGSPYGGMNYRVVKDCGDMLTFINLMTYDAGSYYDPRAGYESYRAIYKGPINVGFEVAPEGAGGNVLKLNANGVKYDADVMTGKNISATKYYNVETIMNYVKNKGQPGDGFMLWQIWKERVHARAPSGAASVNQIGQFLAKNFPLPGNPNDAVPTLPKLTP